jgi:hypothetical protein
MPRVSRKRKEIEAFVREAVREEFGESLLELQIWPETYGQGDLFGEIFLRPTMEESAAEEKMCHLTTATMERGWLVFLDYSLNGYSQAEPSVYPG